jgi:hypothetical protein
MNEDSESTAGDLDALENIATIFVDESTNETARTI